MASGTRHDVRSGAGEALTIASQQPALNALHSLSTQNAAQAGAPMKGDRAGLLAPECLLKIGSLQCGRAPHRLPPQPKKTERRAVGLIALEVINRPMAGGGQIRIRTGIMLVMSQLRLPLHHSPILAPLGIKGICQPLAD